MERKKMHKRKGQWITISTSLIASMMVGASSQTIAAAQEDVAYIPEEGWTVEQSALSEEVVEAEVYTEPASEEVTSLIEETIAEVAEVVEPTEATVVEAVVTEEIIKEVVNDESAATGSANVVEEVVEIEETAPVGDEPFTEIEADSAVDLLVETPSEESVVLDEIEIVSEPVAVEVEAEAEAEAEVAVEAEAEAEVIETTPETVMTEESYDDSGEEHKAETPIAESIENTEIDTAIVEFEVEESVATPEVEEPVVIDEVEAEDADELDETESSEEVETSELPSEDSETDLEEDLVINEEAETIELPEANLTEEETTGELFADEITEEEDNATEEDPSNVEIESEEDTYPEEVAQEPTNIENPINTESSSETEDSSDIYPQEQSQATEESEPKSLPAESEPTQPVSSDSTENSVTTLPKQESSNPNPTSTTSSQKVTTQASDRLQTLATTSATNDKPSYTINRGDTLWSLARRHQVTVTQLKDWNNLSSDMIIANASLIVSNPNNATSTSDEKRQQNVGNQATSDTTSNKLAANTSPNQPQAEGDNTPANTPQTTSYTISRGDTLWSIAQRHNVSLDDLREWNNLSGNLIHSNQHLIVSNPNATSNAGDQAPKETDTSIPSDTPTQAAQQTHIVGRGDYLYAIARQYGVSLSQLSAWNNLTTSSVIHPRDQIIVSNPNASGNQSPDTPQDTKDKEANGTEAVDSANKQAVIDWFQEREGQVTYSMTNRMGPDSYDCSSAVFYALMAGGYLDDGTWPGTTESLYALEGSLLTPISRDEVQAGDLFVAGYKGSSLGAGGHTGLALNNSSIIHANYSDNGISTTPIEGYTSYAGMPTYWYRLNEAFANH